MHKVQPYDYDALAQLLGDKRTDVASLARETLLALVKSEPGALDRFVSDASAKLISARILAEFVRADLAFEDRHIEALCGLLKDIDPEFRRTAIDLLRSPYMEVEKASWVAEALTADVDPNVRDAAFRRLDGLAHTGGKKSSAY